MPARPAFAYLFERFPSFTQTFTVREAQGVADRGLLPRIYSIRRPEGEPPQDFPDSIRQQVRYLPETAEMRAEIRRLKDEKQLPKQVAKTLRELNEAGETADKTRFYEAAWLGRRLREEGIRHVHVHFAGIAARTAWWLNALYGISFSFTAHANDFFVKDDFRVSLAQLVEKAAFIVHVSDYGRLDMAARFPAAAGKMLTIYNGLDLDEYAQTSGTCESLPRGWQEDGQLLIVSIGRLIEKKGFADLIKACAMLAPKLEVRCAVAGEGPLREELEGLITDLDLSSRVQLLGNQSQAEIRRLLSACHVFALACVTEADGGKDNLPTVITEAMAMAKPVVSTRLAGVPEQVLDGVTGRLAEPGDVPGLAQCLEEVLLQGGTYALAGRAHAQEYFAIEVTTAKLAEALVIRGRARPPLAYALRRPWLLLRCFFG